MRASGTKKVPSREERSAPSSGLSPLSHSPSGRKAQRKPALRDSEPKAKNLLPLRAVREPPLQQNHSGYITVTGARVHNLKNINVRIPRNRLVVFTGVSGSGKSSLAFDTIFAEGQRRYLESLSSYARQFLGQFSKPDVEQITGLSPAISIDQKSASHNPRSTVGTVTEIHDYLRVLFARMGVQHCYKCGREVGAQTLDQIVDRIIEKAKGKRALILAPLVVGRKGEYRDIFQNARRSGYTRVRINGTVVDLREEIVLDKKRKQNIELVVDRIEVSASEQQRITESVETALREGEGNIILNIADEEKDIPFSERSSCTYCGISYPELTPQMFSFNSPYGMCPTCKGLGILPEPDESLIVPNPNLSITMGAIKTWGAVHEEREYHFEILKTISRRFGFDPGAPWKKIPDEAKRLIMDGGLPIKLHGRVHITEGVLNNLKRLLYQTSSEAAQHYYRSYMVDRPCRGCDGKRLSPTSLAVRFKGETIDRILSMTVSGALGHFDSLRFTDREETIGGELTKEIKSRLRFLENVGLHYLTMDRSAPTLSGGESQRIRLASQIGSGLVGVLYILDEPSIGLHQRDNRRLLDTLIELRNLGNTIIVVEHDREVMETSDCIFDFGPGAGIDGGEIVAFGPPGELKLRSDTLTAKYLSGELRIPVPGTRRKGNGQGLSILGASCNNLKEIDVTFPLGLFICVTGVSGSGKSSLINETLYKAAKLILYRSSETPGSFREIVGLRDNIDKVVNISQSPIGRTPRSNPVTYTGVFDEIRDLFSKLPESRVRGYKPGRFSFNVRGGRCEACEGAGVKRIQMTFLPDVYVKCNVCRGMRYNRETLQVRYKGKNVSDVLNLTVKEASLLFSGIPPITRILQTLIDVGMDYIQLGQPAPTLSGGESQRVKLAKELSTRSTGRTLYLLDEPTTGLHFADIQKLLQVLSRLVDAGNTVIVIEHHLDIIKTADYIIDLGPEGGEMGGYVIAQGTPEKVTRAKSSYTGAFLRPILNDKKNGK